MNEIVIVALLNCSTLFVCLHFCRVKGIWWFHPIMLFLCYYFIGYCLRPILISFNGQVSHVWDYIGYTPLGGDLLFSSLNTNLGLFAFIFGTYALFPNWFQPNRLPSLNLNFQYPLRFGLALLIIAVAGLAALSVAHESAPDGTVFAYDVDIDGSGGQRLVGVSGYSTIAAEFLPASILVVVMAFGFKWPTLSLLIPFVGLRLWIGSGRSAFLLLAFTAMLVYCVQRRITRIPLSFVAIAISLVLVFDVIGSNRLVVRQLLSGGTDVGETLSSYSSARSSDAFTADFAEFDVSTAVFSYVPQRTGFNWFSQYLRLLIWPIPRQFWEEKPVYTSIIELNQVGNFFGLSLSVMGDFYTNFGTISLVLGMVVLGTFLSWVFQAAVRGRSPFYLLWFWTSYMYLPSLFRDGPVSFVYLLICSGIAVFVLTKAGGAYLYERKYSGSELELRSGWRS